jgi:hypothetical protein
LNEPKVGPEEDAEESERQGVDVMTGCEDKMGTQCEDKGGGKKLRVKGRGQETMTRNISNFLPTQCRHYVYILFTRLNQRDFPWYLRPALSTCADSS